MQTYEAKYTVKWGDLDANGHMKNTAYLDYAGNTRWQFFAACGFPISEFRKLRIGPIVWKDEVRYHKELFLLDEFVMDIQFEITKEDGSKFHVINRAFTTDGTEVVSVKSEAAWFDLKERKVTAPPPGLLEVIRSAPVVAKEP